MVSLRSTTGYMLGCLRHSFEGSPAIQLLARAIPGSGEGVIYLLGENSRPVPVYEWSRLMTWPHIHALS